MYFFTTCSILLLLCEVTSRTNAAKIYPFNMNDFTDSHYSDCQGITTIRSVLNKEGVIESPLIYEEMSFMSYSDRFRPHVCNYIFMGHEGERIQLIYEYFNLYHSLDEDIKFKSINCRYVDSLCVSFYNRNNLKAVAYDKNNLIDHDRCECTNITYSSKQIMSPENFLHLQFKFERQPFSKSSLKPQYRNKSKETRVKKGFAIRYKFIKDYGFNKPVNSTTTAVKDKNNCTFDFRSSERKQGTFSTPNYPGLYPRSVICKYWFHGNQSEKIQITFQTFDIEGVGQCNLNTKSDYVELSNFRNRDRKYKRYCGANKPKPLLSDDNFFQIIFESNDIFDGKGFQATYQFLNFAKPESKF